MFKLYNYRLTRYLVLLMLFFNKKFTLFTTKQIFLFFSIIKNFILVEKL
ncbi:hypothetical protein C8N26_1489 [Tenacibaculum lutimaris]|uniref:Uncharacterized protein n=1 Tax=Tenacibaculum lutimaris TaxID=285258 RepID=A0A420E1B1_9FLAO|nr:hypothetical protein C8N26_1489 [Tenacibaculum lutimaris]